MAEQEDFRRAIEAPVPIAPHTYKHFYNGGKLRAKFMGEPDPKDDYRSEEWFFSTNRAITPGRENPPDKGFSRIRLPSGEVVLLQQLLEALPEPCLGRKHVERFGPKLGILAKIFDVGEGAHIPVHWHPSPGFAQKYLDDPNGKNEAWVVIDTRPGAKVWVGWKEDVPRERFMEWLRNQDRQAMVDHMHVFEPRPRDVIFLRDSYPHSLGSGCCILEPQEPTDWNILAEWEEFPYEKSDAALGLDWETAVEAVTFEAMPRDYLENYVRRSPQIARQEDGSVEEKLVPDEARQYFDVKRMIVNGQLSMPGDQGFYCVCGISGEGKLAGPFGEVPVSRGTFYFIPACLPGYRLVSEGEEALEVVCCYPPAT
ncbi:MAG: class I mannose-6-phosphate isomerase [Candidatus Brocadiia bacterium]